VRTYYQECTAHFRNVHLLYRTLLALGNSTGPVTRLRLVSLSNFLELFQVIASNPPQFESLQLYTVIGGTTCALLASLWKVVPRSSSRCHQSSTRSSQPRRVEIRFARLKRAEYISLIHSHTLDTHISPYITRLLSQLAGGKVYCSLSTGKAFWNGDRACLNAKVG
jgi:hypothetical protein